MQDLDLMPRLSALEEFSDESKVWFYIANKPISAQGQQMAEYVLGRFLKGWTAHNNALKSAGELYAGRIMLLMVDETQAGASGCSIDKSVHFLKRLGSELQVDFFDPFTSAWADAENLYFGDITELKLALKNNREGLQIINSQIKTKLDLKTKWLLKVEDSWQNRFV